ncbi:MAG: type II secretion system protein GspM [Pseudomonadota bacterium]
MNTLRTWWSGLNERDRRMLLIGLGLALPLLGYALLWQPLEKARNAARQAHAETAAQLDEVRRLGAQLAGQRSARPANAPSADLSPLSAAEAAAREQGLLDALKRRESDGAQGVRLMLEGAAADALMRMLETLALTHGLRVEQAQIEPVAPGRVNANLSLKRSKP